MKWILLCLGSLLCLGVFAQVQVKGFIRDINGDPVAGAIIKDDADKILSVADTSGRFAFSANDPSGYVLAEAIGFDIKRVPYVVGKELDIVLARHEYEIEEVHVHDGYQQLPKERSAGSFTVVDRELLDRRPTRNILEMLQGVAPGLQFDNREGSPRLNIRGINTFSSGLASPLIVVDNFPFEGDLSSINPNDVESVTLLKDATASSIWGARAGNGVLVITTKKAKDGEGITGSFTNNLMTRPRPDIFYEDVMRATDFIDVELELYERGFYNNQLRAANQRRIVVSPVVDMLDKRDRKLLSAEEADREIERLRHVDYRDDLYRYFYRNEFSQQHHFNLNNPGTIWKYSIYGGYDRNLQNIQNSSSRRITLRQSNVIKPVKNIEFGADIAFTHSQDRFGGGANPNNTYPHTDLVHPDGTAAAVPYMYNPNFLDTVGRGVLLDWRYRPYDELSNTERVNKGNYLSTLVRATYLATDALKLQVTYGMERQDGTGENEQQLGAYYVRDQINYFTQIGQDGSIKYIVPKGGMMDRSYSWMFSHRLRGNLTYDEVWGGHRLSVLAGSEVSNRRNGANSYRTYGYDPETLTSTWVDHTNPYPIVGGLGSTGYIPQYGGQSASLRRFVSVFGNMAYTFKDRYIANFSARRDGSNLFGVNTNDRWNPLWSIGGAWLVTKEDFMSGVAFLELLKIRATIGHSGNSGPGGNAQPILRYNTQSGQYTNYPTAYISSPPNPNLRWENVRTTNIALDFSLWKGRFSGSVEWFDKKSTDLLSSDVVDPTTGYSTVTRNIGEINGRGWDVDLRLSLPAGRVSWETSIGYSNATNEVAVYNGLISSSLSYASGAGQTFRPVVGKQLYPIYSYQYGGLDPENGDPLGYINGERTKDYRTVLNDSLGSLDYHGSALAPSYGYFRTSLAWKKWQLYISMAYSFGHYFQKNTISYNGLYTGRSGHGDFYRRWQKPGDERHTNVPSMVYPADGLRDQFYAYSGANIRKADFIRLQDVRLSYSLRRPRVNLALSANNIGLLWTANNDGVDPEYLFMPPSGVYSFSINLNL